MSTVQKLTGPPRISPVQESFRRLNQRAEENEAAVPYKTAAVPFGRIFESIVEKHPGKDHEEKVEHAQGDINRVSTILAEITLILTQMNREAPAEDKSAETREARTLYMQAILDRINEISKITEEGADILKQTLRERGLEINVEGPALASA